jgi:hypothetical protein
MKAESPHSRTPRPAASRSVFIEQEARRRIASLGSVQKYIPILLEAVWLSG